MSTQNPPNVLEAQVVKTWLFTQNADGSLSPATTGGGSSGNVNLTGINSVAPAFTNALPVELSDGTNPVGTPSNPLSVNVITGGGSNASVGLTGATAPTSATEIGIIVAGLLQGVSATNPLPISVASLPLPALAATSTKQSDGTQKTQVVDGSGNVIGSTANALDVNIKSGITNPLPVTGPLTDAQLRATPVPISGTVAAITAQVDTNLKQVGGANTATAASGVQKVGIVGGATGVTLDAVLGATKPANVLQVGGNDGTNAYALPLASGGGSAVISGAVSFTVIDAIVFQEILIELRAMRRLLMLVYEESGEGNPASILSDDSIAEDYN
jgi:hypothetical protein